MKRCVRHAGLCRSAETAQALYSAGLSGGVPARCVALDTLNNANQASAFQVRLWPQKQWLEADALGSRNALVRMPAPAITSHQVGAVTQALSPASGHRKAQVGGAR